MSLLLFLVFDVFTYFSLSSFCYRTNGKTWFASSDISAEELTCLRNLIPADDLDESELRLYTLRFMAELYGFYLLCLECFG